MSFGIKLTQADSQHQYSITEQDESQRKKPRVKAMKTSCVLALLPLLCGLALAQGELL